VARVRNSGAHETESGVSESREIPRLTRTSRQELELPLADGGRYRIRARLVVELVNGQTISKTATRWINPGNALPKES